jgi:membrane-associated PAP2 superfamily phosphatase
MPTRLDKAIFWFALNFATIDFHTTLLLFTVVVGIGLGVLVSLAGSERLQPAQ